MKSTYKQENGQAIVLIALAFIVLLAFAGLAIDGGIVYSNRRHAQNAADSGSLAGGGAAAIYLENEFMLNSKFACGTTTVNHAISLAENAAENLMLANGYNSTDFTITTECEDNDPGYFNEKYIDISTQIITDTKTTLIQVVYDGPVQNLVNSTTRIKPRIPLAFGQAVVGLNEEEDCDNASAGGVKFGGTGDVEIDGGGVWSNGCIVAQGDCAVDVDDGDIAYHGGSFGTCPVMDPLPGYEEDKLPEDSYFVPEPDCSKAGAITLNNIKLSGHQTLVLNDSYPDTKLICLESTGNAIQMTGGTLTGDGYTFYLKNSGDIDINGGIVTLVGPSRHPDPDPAIPGIIFYVNPDESSAIDITGNISSTYMGMIYGPAADIKISGTGDVGPTYNTQIIGFNVSLLGTARIDINFDETWNYSKPTSLDLHK